MVGTGSGHSLVSVHEPVVAEIRGDREAVTIQLQSMAEGTVPV